MSKRFWILLLLLLMLPPMPKAQLLVHDPGLATIESNTSIQSTISAVESVVQSAYLALDLEPLSDLTFSVDYLQTLAVLQELVAEGQGLMGDAARAQAQIERLFGLEHTPSDLKALSERIVEVKAVVYQARAYAVRTQTLMSTIGSALGHLSRIIELVGVMVGNRQGHQATLHALSTANVLLATQAAQAAAQQRAQIVNELARSMVLEAYTTMEARRWDGWPSL